LKVAVQDTAEDGAVKVAVAAVPPVTGQLAPLQPVNVTVGPAGTAVIITWLPTGFWQEACWLQPEMKAAPVPAGVATTDTVTWAGAVTVTKKLR
jgi:hypothetical protein